MAGIVGGVVHGLDMENPAKYTRHTPRIDAPMAATRRWPSVVVLAVAWRVLVMVDMALPSGQSGVSRAHATLREPGTQKLEQRPPTAGLLAMCCGPVSGLTRGGLWPRLQESPSHAVQLAQWI